MSADTETYFDGVLQTLLSTAGNGASDLLFLVGQPPQVEINGVLTPIEVPGLMPVLRPEHTQAFATEIMGDNERLQTALRDHGSCDTSHALGDTARFRVNIFRQY